MQTIWKTVAFLGRYGHQSVEECLRMPVVDLCDLSSEIGELIRNEGEAMRSAGND